MYQVTKRDGQVVDFEITKIAEAIRKAFDAKNKQYHPSVIDFLALRVTADFEKKINDGLEKGAKITVSKDPADISDGFILVYGDIEINCSFEALIEDSRDAIKDELNSIFFA